jgi:hypothetical protein
MAESTVTMKQKRREIGFCLIEKKSLYELFDRPMFSSSSLQSIVIPRIKSEFLFCWYSIAAPVLSYWRMFSGVRLFRVSSVLIMIAISYTTIQFQILSTVIVLQKHHHRSPSILRKVRVEGKKILVVRERFE